MGVVTPVGLNVDDFWNSLLQGVSGISRIEHFDTTDFPTKIAGSIKNFQPEAMLNLDRKEIRHMDRFVQFAVAASKMALSHSGLEITEDIANRVGVYIGSGIGGLMTLEEQHRNLLERGPKRVSPFFIPMMIGNMASGQVSILFGAKGPNSAPVSACATSANAIGDAFKMIERGIADAMICGGAESTLTPLAFAGFCSAKALSERNEEPERASRPFDSGRDGFVMGEGAGIIVLEELEFAKKRGANIIAEVVGYGMSADAYHLVQPDPNGDGAARSMQAAVDDAGISLQDVDYINAHGTSTPLGDLAETKAVKTVFGEHAYKLSVSSTKSMTGHLLGAAGGIEAIASILAIRDHIMPPTINLDDPDPECDLDYVPNQPKTKDLTYTMSNSFGFGGHNASLIFKKYAE